MDIRNLDKATLLAALIKAAVPNVKHHVSYEEAKEIIDTRLDLHFMFWHKHPLDIDLTGDEVDTTNYNENVGDGMAEAVANTVRQTGKVPDNIEVSDSKLARMIGEYIEWRTGTILRLLEEAGSDEPVVLETEEGPVLLEDDAAEIYRVGMLSVLDVFSNSPLRGQRVQMNGPKVMH